MDRGAWSFSESGGCFKAWPPSRSAPGVRAENNVEGRQSPGKNEPLVTLLEIQIRCANHPPAVSPLAGALGSDREDSGACIAAASQARLANSASTSSLLPCNLDLLPRTLYTVSSATPQPSLSPNPRARHKRALEPSYTPTTAPSRHGAWPVLPLPPCTMPLPHITPSPGISARSTTSRRSRRSAASGHSSPRSTATAARPSPARRRLSRASSSSLTPNPDP